MDYAFAMATGAAQTRMRDECCWTDAGRSRWARAAGARASCAARQTSRVFYLRLKIVDLTLEYQIPKVLLELFVDGEIDITVNYEKNI